jgi:hypothetical protein
MSNFESCIEKSAPNSGGPPDVNWANGSGMMLGDLWAASIANAFAAAYSRFGTSGSFGLYETVSRASGTAGAMPKETRQSPDEIAFESHRSRLIAAVSSMKAAAPNWYGTDAKVSEESASTAEKFLRCLPFGSALPKVAADGEGDVMFVWEGPGISCVVTVEPKTLHLVSRPGSKTVQQIDGQKFLGVQIPPTILRHIPSK